MFYNLFSRKKKITSPAAAPEKAVETPGEAVTEQAAVEAEQAVQPTPEVIASAPIVEREIEPVVELVVEPAVEPVSETVVEPAQGDVELPVSVVKPRTARATSPRTSSVKVAPPKATPATRPGSKPAAKPITGIASPTTSTSNRVHKPSKQGLLDAVAPAATEVPVPREVPTASLTTLTVPQLRVRAKELGLVGYSRLPKAELVRMITEKLNADGPGVPPESPQAS